MSGNIGYLFYQEYFDGLNWEHPEDEKRIKDIVRKNEQIIYNKSANIINTEWSADKTIERLLSFTGPRIMTFKLKTRPPGLLIGSGIAHEAGIEGEFKLGLYFDHTSGWPYIPGSSIKGVLRSAFGHPHPEYIQELVAGITGKQIEIKDVEDLKNEIFEGKRGNKEIGMYDRDCFLDAHITKAPEKPLNDDYITPHRHPNRDKSYLDPFVNPIPIRFLKVEPGVEFTFFFIPHDSQIVPELNKAKKMKIFGLILKDLGVGAKTNVGYGGLE